MFFSVNKMAKGRKTIFEKKEYFNLIRIIAINQRLKWCDLYKIFNNKVKQISEQNLLNRIKPFLDKGIIERKEYPDDRRTSEYFLNYYNLMIYFVDLCFTSKFYKILAERLFTKSKDDLEETFRVEFTKNHYGEYSLNSFFLELHEDWTLKFIERSLNPVEYDEKVLELSKLKE